MSTSDRKTIPKVWITQYALTTGVITIDGVEHCTDISEKMISCGGGYTTKYYHKPHWHTSEEGANARVRAMLEAKIKSAQQSLSKLQAMLKQYGGR